MGQSKDFNDASTTVTKGKSFNSHTTFMLGYGLIGHKLHSGDPVDFGLNAVMRHCREHLSFCIT